MSGSVHTAAPPAATPVLPAATVVVLRDSAQGAEALLVQRHGQSPFMPGATVFPGGKIDADDSAAETASQAAELPGFEAATAVAARVAAIRELHEEAHVLLARDAEGRVPHADRVATLDSTIEGLRQGRRLRSADWHKALRALGLRADPAAVVAFAHWLTPAAEPRRFDTVFFAAQLPPHQRASLDRHETTALRWMAPATALAAHASGGDVLLPPPTLHTLQRLAALAQRHGDAAGIVDALAREGMGPRIQPHFTLEAGGGPTIVLPWDPLHPERETFCRLHGQTLAQMTAVTPSGDTARDRFVLHSGRFDRVHD